MTIKTLRSTFSVLLLGIPVVFLLSCNLGSAPTKLESQISNPAPDSIFTSKNIYPWLSKQGDFENALVNRIPVPEGYERIELPKGSFGEWLRFLPLKPGKPPVHLHNGNKKWNQNAHVVVVNVDVGEKDLQQCADAVMRMRGEFLYSQNKFDEINFNFTSGDANPFSKWIKGYRPSVRNDKVSWSQSAAAGSDYSIFKKYIFNVFIWSGTVSLRAQMKPVSDVNDIMPGDVFVLGGFPGHAELVVDVARHQETGKKIFLLAQSYMPAQDFHILKNPMDRDLSPWYSVDFGDELVTPEYTLGREDLRRF